MNKIRSEFQVHMLTEEGKLCAYSIACAFTELLDTLERLVPASSREMAIVRTKLEEASFFAKKAMAKHNAVDAPTGQMRPKLVEGPLRVEVSDGVIRQAMGAEVSEEVVEEITKPETPPAIAAKKECDCPAGSYCMRCF